MGAGSLAGPEHGGSVGPLTHPDHGVGGGPVARLHLDGLLAQLEAAGTDAVILHKGALRRVDPARFRRMSLVLHLNASTALAPDPDAKYPVATVAEALSLGATAVSVHVNIGSATEDKQIAHLAEVAADCARWGMPLLAMMYVRPPAWGPDRIAPNAGRLTPDASRLTPDASRLATDGSRLAPDVGRLAPDVGRHAPDVGRFASDVSRLALDGGRFARDVARFAPDPDQLAHALAVATELGADLVKTALPSSPAAAAQVIRSCPVPVLAAGGAVDGDSLDRLAVAMRAGAGGIAAGRLVFTAPDPGAMARRLAELVSSSSRAPEVLVG
ncbi:hypothetical protein [Symbioplanes lichenis]|uniref:hypothetical protein n=1 Tax=Symbioplanes lichenis TaxID=1629072 RepID=UPI0027383C80|nr:hypothetical protein [Actinoplanes lichenis]